MDQVIRHEPIKTPWWSAGKQFDWHSKWGQVGIGLKREQVLREADRLNKMHIVLVRDHKEWIVPAEVLKDFAYYTGSYDHRDGTDLVVVPLELLDMNNDPDLVELELLKHATS